MEHKKAPKPPTPEEEASGETTSPERLRELAQQDAKLARIVATNPNTPTETLLELGAQFPEELLNNPVFDLLLLENPNLLAQMPQSTLKSLVKLEIMPKSLLNWTVNNASENVLIALLCNPQVSRENLSKLITKHPNSHLAEAAKLHINWDEEIDNPEEFVQKAISNTDLTIPKKEEEIFSVLLLRQMISAKWISYLVMATNSLIRANVAGNPHTPVSLLEKLATDSDEYVRLKVACHPNIPVSVLERLATDSHSMVRLSVTCHPNTPVSLLEILATDSELQVRRFVAYNPNTPVSLLEKLATDSYSNVAQNPNTPVSLLEILATDVDWNVRSDVAYNPNTPVSVLEKLATDSDYLVRYYVAYNPNTPVSLLEILATDVDWNVRSGVASNPNTPVSLLEKLATDSDENVRLNVAKNTNTPVSLLEKLATDSAMSDNLAKNPNTPVSLLEKLATDSDKDVRCNLAKNPNTPVSVLKRLVTDSDKDVRCNVAKNPNTPVSVLIAQFNSLAKGTQPNLGRLTVFLSPYAQVAHLVNNFRSEHWLERYAIAQNANTPDNTLKDLVNDSNKLVRQAASVNLQQKQEQNE